jgi:hypothetical protein
VNAANYIYRSANWVLGITAIVLPFVALPLMVA